MPAMPHTCQNVSYGILDVGDGDGTNLSGSAEDAGTVPGVKIKGRGGVSADEPSEPERRGTGEQGRVPPPSPLGRPGLIKPPPPKQYCYSVVRQTGICEGGEA